MFKTDLYYTDIFKEAIKYGFFNNSLFHVQTTFIVYPLFYSFVARALHE